MGYGPFPETAKSAETVAWLESRVGLVAMQRTTDFQGGCRITWQKFDKSSLRATVVVRADGSIPLGLCVPLVEGEAPSSDETIIRINDAIRECEELRTEKQRALAHVEQLLRDLRG